MRALGESNQVILKAWAPSDAAKWLALSQDDGLRALQKAGMTYEKNAKYKGVDVEVYSQSRSSVVLR